MIEKLIVQNEGKTLEFKENAQSLQRIIKTIIAFANTAGGTIVIGVEDKTKKVVGINKSLNEEERLINGISDSISPLLIPNIEIQTYRKKELIIIQVPLLAGPYYLKSAGPEKGVFVRSGSTNRVADSEMLENLRLFAKKTTYDEIPYPQLKNNKLDWDAIEKSFTKVGKKISKTNALDLGILTDIMPKTVPTFGGIILFGVDRIKAFPDALIRCVRFKSIDRSNILDHTEIKTYPIFALDQAIHFIEKNTMTGAEIGRIYRTDIPQYPPVAIREAIVNAIIHSDYSIKGISIIIAIFDDRIEISNPGGLPLGMTLERALSGSSRVRNRVIAKVFRELKIIEQWGSGLQRIIDACTQRGLLMPKFEDHSTEFKVTIYATIDNKSRNITSEREFIDYLKQKERISTKEAASFWNITPRNARLRLKKLVEAQFIKKIGTSERDPKSSYILTPGIEFE